MLLKDLVADQKFVLLDFYADWCEPCKWADPVMEDALSKIENRPPLIKINIDDQPTLTKELHVLSVPTFILLKDGKEIWRMRGFDTANKIILQLQPHLS